MRVAAPPSPVPGAVREGQRRRCLVPRGACGLGKGRVLTEVCRRRLRGFIARPWVLLWLVGFLVVCRDPGSTGPSGEQASVWPVSGESDASGLLSGRPSCEATRSLLCRNRHRCGGRGPALSCRPAVSARTPPGCDSVCGRAAQPVTWCVMLLQGPRRVLSGYVLPCDCPQ